MTLIIMHSFARMREGGISLNNSIYQNSYPYSLSSTFLANFSESPFLSAGTIRMLSNAAAGPHGVPSSPGCHRGPLKPVLLLTYKIFILMNINRNIRSLAEFKLHAPEFVQQLKEAGEPLILAINGKAELVVQDAASYRKLLDIAEEPKVLEGIRRGLEDMKVGRAQPLEAALADIRRDLQLPHGS